MNFSWEKGLIWMDIKIEYNGKSYHIENCIVDTGSASTAIDIEQVAFDYDRPTRIKRLSGIGGTQEVVSQKIESLGIGEVKLNDVFVEFGNLQNSYGIRGFVGNDVLSHFQITIDFKDHQIYLM